MHDLVTLGEVMLRLAIPSPTRIETVTQLDVQVGGAEANVAAACARLGLRTAWISALPGNAWGERIRRGVTGYVGDRRPRPSTSTTGARWGSPGRPATSSRGPCRAYATCSWAKPKRAPCSAWTG